LVVVKQGAVLMMGVVQEAGEEERAVLETLG
jgi:osmotically-inducible protein OsmY